MVYLLMMGKDIGMKNCGGFLIREDFVLTAAHCNAENITAILGAHNIMSPENSQQIINVVKAIPFPAYCRSGPNDDIMLLKLEKKATLDEKVAILPLSQNKERLKVGSTCSTAGWGLVESEGSHMVSKLQEVNMSVFRRLCAAKWGAMFTEYMTCASSPMKGGCNGDSGGPLVCDGVAHGVLSFSSEPCGYFPTVFMKISMYTDWITREMGRH
ncbi:MCPT3 protease, partial [Polyodon spathula]|nr:MCPT3 protease [Polyodon spathula]